MQRLEQAMREREEGSMSQSISVSGNKLDDLSAIYCTSLQGSLTESNLRPTPIGQRKSRICLKKKKNAHLDPTSHTKSQVNNEESLKVKYDSLLKEVSYLKGRLMMAEIDRDHYHRELEISLQRQGSLVRSKAVCWVDKENRDSSNITSNCKCVRLEESMGRLTEML